MICCVRFLRPDAWSPDVCVPARKIAESVAFRELHKLTAMGHSYDKAAMDFMRKGLKLANDGDPLLEEPAPGRGKGKVNALKEAIPRCNSRPTFPDLPADLRDRNYECMLWHRDAVIQILCGSWNFILRSGGCYNLEQHCKPLSVAHGASRWNQRSRVAVSSNALQLWLIAQ